ncbi:MAG: hypothetical protein HC787_08310 [Nostocaceae cyanobacterium CSU_2_110]|nr:hypothetical protein [Nostocaceae cyanobacterium CSU_2_110]
MGIRWLNWLHLTERKEIASKASHHLRERKKKRVKGHGTVEPRVGKTRYGIPLGRVGQRVISLRYSENI